MKIAKEFVDYHQWLKYFLKQKHQLEFEKKCWRYWFSSVFRKKEWKSKGWNLSSVRQLNEKLSRMCWNSLKFIALNGIESINNFNLSWLQSPKWRYWRKDINCLFCPILIKKISRNWFSFSILRFCEEIKFWKDNSPNDWHTW
jgi:hypothetical protein